LNQQSAEGQTCLGNVALSGGQYEDAVALYQRALKLNPEGENTLGQLALAYEKLGNPAAAEPAYKQAVALRPNYWAVYNWLGIFYYNRGQYSKAAEMFQKVTGLAPDNYVGYSNLGGVYVTQGRYEDAIQAFQHSIDLRPDADAYNNLGYAYILMHRFPEAIAAQRQALKLNEGNTEIWGNIGDALYWSPNQRPEAASQYRRAVAIATSRLQVNPRDAETLAYLANYFAMLDSRQQALSQLKHALELAPSDGEVLFRAALVYNHFGDTEQTLTYLKKAADAGYSRAIIRDSPDFMALQQNSQFKALTATQ